MTPEQWAALTAEQRAQALDAMTPEQWLAVAAKVRAVELAGGADVASFIEGLNDVAAMLNELDPETLPPDERAEWERQAARILKAEDAAKLLSDPDPNIIDAMAHPDIAN